MSKPKAVTAYEMDGALYRSAEDAVREKEHAEMLNRTIAGFILGVIIGLPIGIFLGAVL